jgi:aminopeptidase N
VVHLIHPKVLFIAIVCYIFIKGLTTLSNMPISSTGPYSESPDTLALTSFLPSPKMSSYLLAWVVGEFDFVSGSCYEGKMPINVYCIKGRASSCHFALKVRFYIIV